MLQNTLYIYIYIFYFWKKSCNYHVSSPSSSDFLLSKKINDSKKTMQYNLWHLFSQNNPWLLSFKDTAYTTNGIKQTGFIRGLILQKGKAEVYLLQPSFIFFCFIAVVLFKLCKVEKQYEIQDVQMGYPSSVGLISAEEVARYLQIRGNMLVGVFLFVSKSLADVIKWFLLVLLKKKCNSPLLWNQSQSRQQLPDSSFYHLFCTCE